MCLTAACGDSLPDEPPVMKRIMPLEPCPNDINEAPGDPILSSLQRLDLKIERAKAILDKYESLIVRAAEVAGDFSGLSVDRAKYEYDFLKLLDADEPLEYKTFIEVWFATDDVDQSKLPPEERIPHCLEGVPVHFLTNRPYSTIGN